MRRWGGWSAFSIVCLFAMHATLAFADPQVGWWWNPAESGRGFFIESQGGIFYMAAYVYADDGRARWLVAGGPNADPSHFSGRLLEYADGQGLFGPYVAPSTPVDIGAIAVDFSDDMHGTITWPGGVVPIEREIFGTGPALYQPESGWWWNPAESGSGYSIEVQGGNLFFVGFMYDGAGKPVWYYSAGPMKSPTTYSGTLQQYANGQTLTGPYHPPSAPATLGSVAIAFSAPDAATLTFTGAAGPAKAGSSRSIGIGREFQPVPHRYDYPIGYSGSFAQLVEIHAVQGPLTVDVSALAIGTNLIWNRATGVPPPPDGVNFTGQPAKYVPTGGKVVVAVTYSAVSAAASCTGNASQTFSFVDLQSSLIVTNLAEYVMQIGMAGENLQVSVPTTCIVGTQTFAGQSFIEADAVKLISQKLFAQDLILTGSVGPIAETPNFTRTGSWQLIELRNGYR